MTIAEVSKKFGLSPDTLRYYERIGLIPRVNRNESGIRDYTEEDCKWIEFIKCMRSAGVQVETLVEYVTLLQQGDKTIEARKQILIEQREKLLSRIEEMERALERLNFKIEEYETKLIPAENNLKRLAQLRKDGLLCDESKEAQRYIYFGPPLCLFHLGLGLTRL